MMEESMQQYDRGYRRNVLWQMSPVNTLIIVINVLVFAGLSFLGDTTDVRHVHLFILESITC